jgi:hypothetical protein
VKKSSIGQKISKNVFGGKEEERKRGWFSLLSSPPSLSTK